MDVLAVAEALRNVTPRRAGAELPDHRLNEQAVAAVAVASGRARPPRQKMLDPGELGVAVVAPAIANALYSATDLRFRRLPLFAEEL